jgi:hypothetical protein
MLYCASIINCEKKHILNITKYIQKKKNICYDSKKYDDERYGYDGYFKLAKEIVYGNK